MQNNFTYTYNNIQRVQHLHNTLKSKNVAAYGIFIINTCFNFRLHNLIGANIFRST